MRYPEAYRTDFSEKVHGVTVADPYRWMERGDDPRLTAWLAAENRLTRAYLKNIPARDRIARRLKQLWHVDSVNIPTPRGDRYFAFERKANEELSALYVRTGFSGKRRKLLDENDLSRDRTAVVTRVSISRSGRFVAYGVSMNANDKCSLHVLDVKTGKNLKDRIPDDVYPALYSGIEWSPDERGFWYARRADAAPRSEPKQHHKIYYHALGRDYRKDEMVFGKEVGAFDIPSVMASDDGRFLVAMVARNEGSKRSTDLYIKDLARKGAGFKPIVKGKDAIFYRWVHRDRIFILTNHRAPNYKLMAVPLAEADRGMRAWRTVIPQGKGVIETIRPLGGRLFVETQENVHSVLTMHDLDGRRIKKIPLPSYGSLRAMKCEPEGRELFFSFASFLMPTQVFRFDVDTGRVALFERSRIRFDPSGFVAEQKWYRSKDGTKVPMFLVHKKGVRRDGKNPTMLYGYGGYGNSMLPSFNSTRIPFLEHGGVYAIANIRGGGEFGERWHWDGARRKKQNGFDDFAAAAGWLIRRRYTCPAKLSAYGWSNGGLLMGAMLTQHPNLFKALVIGAPVTDMLRFHKFHGGANWISEYGDPDTKSEFGSLFKYSPYHRLKEERYPAVLLVTAKSDDRVDPSHSYKFAARLQALSRSENPVLLRVEGKAGHGGATSISSSAEQFADIYGFVFEQLGMK